MGREHIYFFCAFSVDIYFCSFNNGLNYVPFYNRQKRHFYEGRTTESDSVLYAEYLSFFQAMGPTKVDGTVIMVIYGKDRCQKIQHYIFELTIHRVSTRL